MSMSNEHMRELTEFAVAFERAARALKALGPDQIAALVNVALTLSADSEATVQDLDVDGTPHYSRRYVAGLTDDLRRILAENAELRAAAAVVGAEDQT